MTIPCSQCGAEITGRKYYLENAKCDKCKTLRRNAYGIKFGKKWRKKQSTSP